MQDSGAVEHEPADLERQADDGPRWTVTRCLEHVAERFAAGVEERPLMEEVLA